MKKPLPLQEREEAFSIRHSGVCQLFNMDTGIHRYDDICLLFSNGNVQPCKALSYLLKCNQLDNQSTQLS